MTGPVEVKAARAALLASGVAGASLRAALVELYDRWLGELLGTPGAGVALVAVGGLGRREVAAGSDLDLVLVHDGKRSDVAALADRVWYPVWDASVGLDHSVRTVEEAVGVARDDLKAALGLLDARHVAGDAALSEELLRAARAAWRRDAERRLPELREAGEQRAREHGEVAFLLEPDLKSAKGGLRDVHALHAVAASQRADPPGPSVRAAHEVLLDVRGELHRRSGSSGRSTLDRLLLQEQDAVAAALGHADADALMAAVSTAARTISYAGETTWRRVLASAPRRGLGLLRSGPGRPGRPGGQGRGPTRTPLADDVVAQDGEVVLARDADPASDPVLVLRVASAAAHSGLPVAPTTLDRLARTCPPLPQPWPRAALDALVSLLAAGPAAVPVFEHLDQADLLVGLLPEWDEVRSRPQRNSYHRFTVDRHLVETAAEAAALTRQVGRPDLLLVGALLHDIGKGRPGDHSLVGTAMVAEIAPRMGFPEADVHVLMQMVEHHLLLPDVATRRDLADPTTAAAVAAKVGSQEVLDLLHALTEADSLATGPAAWSPWKGRLVSELVARTRSLLSGTPVPDPAPLADWQAELLFGGGPAMAHREDEVMVVAEDRRGLLAVAAGVLALHRLDVRSAWAFSAGGTAASVFRVAPRYGAWPDWVVVQSDLLRALAGSVALRERLDSREAAYARPVASAPPVVRLVDDASPTATVVEVRAPDSLGVLHRLTAALDQCGLDVRTAHVSTLGDDVVDAFYVAGPDGGPLTDPDLRAEVERRVLEAARATVTRP